MWKYYNPNPLGRIVPDCVIRALCLVLHRSWVEVSDWLYYIARREYTVSNSDETWGILLWNAGYVPFSLPHTCPQCITIKQFCKIFPEGKYVIGTGSHAVAVVDGDYYDSWDSGNEIPSFFWRKI